MCVHSSLPFWPACVELIKETTTKHKNNKMLYIDCNKMYVLIMMEDNIQNIILGGILMVEYTNGRILGRILGRKRE